MTINIPDDAKSVETRAKTDVKRELPSADPFLKNSWLGAIVTAYANRIYDFYLQLKEAIRQNFPDTATEDYLLRWAAIWGKDRLPATQAAGNVVATGIAGSAVPLGTTLTTADGTYTTTTAGTIGAQVINVSGITRSGQTATVTTDSAHKLASGVMVTISGANQSEYNITAAITVTGESTFQYQVSGSPTTPATGTIQAAATYANMPAVSDLFGDLYNLESGQTLNLQSPLTGVDDALVTDYNGITGGSDEETDDALRARLLDRVQNPVAHFNVSDITETAKEIEGVTRVFVHEITPAVGQVTIYFMMDDRVDPIPLAGDVTTVKNQILTIKPANTADADVIVLAPTGISTNFTFSALVPDTANMRDAIEANLRQFFDESTAVGVNVDEDAYRSAIYNTVEPITGDTVKSFDLSTPTGDVVIAAGEIAILGTVGYAV